MEGVGQLVVVTDSEEEASFRDLDALVVYEVLAAGSKSRMVHRLGLGRGLRLITASIRGKLERLLR